MSTTTHPVIPASHADLLDSTALAHVATLGPSGEPQNNPVWFGWDGEHLRFSQTKARQKYKNVQRDARVALSIVDPANPYRYLEVRGTVVQIDEDPEQDYINAMAQKYLNQEVYPWGNPADERVIIVIRPDHTTTMG